MANEKLISMKFSKIIPLYISKAEKKGRSKSEVDEIIQWLTGYDSKSLSQQISSEIDIKTFFENAPKINPNVCLIKGVVCGVRVEDIEDSLMQQIRYLDKLIDELAKGKALDKILR